MFFDWLPWLMTTFLVCDAFSDGSRLASGDTAVRKLYCGRPAERRDPVHIEPECVGLCDSRLATADEYTLIVNSTTYWLDPLNVTIRSESSNLSVTGFAISAVNEKGLVIGSFQADEDIAAVGTCADVNTYSDEKFTAFHNHADPDRKEVSVIWQPDGYNYGPIRFLAWVVHDHANVYKMHTDLLGCAKNGTVTLDLEAKLEALIKQADLDIEKFENSFFYRQTRGYQLEDENMFYNFDVSPVLEELIPDR